MYELHVRAYVLQPLYSNSQLIMAYMSPEMWRQLLGEEVEVDYFQSDIFSLGVTMLHLAKLTLPTSISQAFANIQQLKEAVQRKSSGLPYSEGLLNLIREMLDSDSTHRPNIERVFVTVSRTLFMEKVLRDSELGPRDFLEIVKSSTDPKYQVTLQLLVLSFKIGSVPREVLFLKFSSYYEVCGRTVEKKGMVEELLLYNKDNALEARFQEEFLWYWIQLTQLYTEWGNFTAAEAAQSKACELFAQLGSNHGFPVADSLALGIIYHKQVKLEEAERMAQQSLSAALEISDHNIHVAKASCQLA